MHARERALKLALVSKTGFIVANLFRRKIGFVLAEAVMLCVLGGVAGLVIATIAAIVVAYATNAPVVVDYRVWGMGLAAIAALSIAVGLLPALKARRLSIVDALSR